MSTTSLKNIYNDVSAKYSPVFKKSMNTFWTKFKEDMKYAQRSGRTTSAPEAKAETKDDFNPIKNAIDGFKQKVSNFIKNTTIGKKLDRAKQASAMQSHVVNNVEAHGPQFGE